jgi:hypothetical protein
MLSSSVLSYPTKSVPITQTRNSTSYVQLWNTHVKACFLHKQNKTKQKKNYSKPLIIWIQTKWNVVYAFIY